MKTALATDEILERLTTGRRVRRSLSDGGQLHIDRPLPFLCIYRQPPGKPDAGTRDLVKGEASFCTIGSTKRAMAEASALLARVAEAMSQRFGAYLIVEVWSAPDCEVAVAADKDDIEPTELQPDFAVSARGPNAPQRTLDSLRRNLQRISIQKQTASVRIDGGAPAHPPGHSYLIKRNDASEWNCDTIGLCVRPVYRDHETGDAFPVVLRTLQRGLGRALKQTFFTFAETRTNVRPEHYYSLGRRAMVKAVWEVDRRLSEISDSFDFLLQVTPVNAEAAWQRFRRSKFQTVPRFYYPPLAVEPGKLKRRLHEVRVENIEDPTLGGLFRQLQDELDRKITLLGDINTRRFLLGSRQIFGDVAPSLLDLAKELLRQLPKRSRDESGSGMLSAQQFAERACKEIEHYRQQLPSFAARAIVREDMFAGLLCSEGKLLIGHRTNIPVRRVEALLQHEVGTHLVTYYNGLSEPFQQLHSGFAGYDALQEGLAVLSEYLVGGMTTARMRLLAARVIAVDMLIQGATFLDCFRSLVDDLYFSQRVAYTIAMRTFRGGGLTKDAVYLQGLVEILDYLRRGGELEPLFVGKIAAQHIPLIQELQHRKVLKPPVLRPRYLDFPGVAERLNNTRTALSLLDVIRGQLDEGRIRRQRHQDRGTDVHDNTVSDGCGELRPRSVADRHRRPGL